MKKNLLVLVLLFSSTLSAQLNQSALQVQQLQPDVYNGIRVLSLVMHEGENYKVSQEINKQSEAYIEVLNYSDDLDLEVLFTLMRRFCADQEQFDYYLNNNRFEECFNLPINWWLVNQNVFNY